jgi:hypothetical protein
MQCCRSGAGLNRTLWVRSRRLESDSRPETDPQLKYWHIFIKLLILEYSKFKSVCLCFKNILFDKAWIKFIWGRIRSRIRTKIVRIRNAAGRAKKNTYNVLSANCPRFFVCWLNSSFLSDNYLLYFKAEISFLRQKHNSKHLTYTVVCWKKKRVKKMRENLL